MGGATAGAGAGAAAWCGGLPAAAPCSCTSHFHVSCLSACSYSTPAPLQVLDDVLSRCLVSCINSGALLGHAAGHLLTPRLAAALLGADRSMPQLIKRAGLGLVHMVRRRGGGGGGA